MLGSYQKQPQLLYHGKFVLHVSVSVSSLPLSVTVCSCHACVVHLSSLRFEFLSRRPLHYGSNPLLLISSAHHLLSARAVFPDSNVRNSLRRSIINPNRNFHFNYLDFPWFNTDVTWARKLRWYILSVINSNSELSLSYIIVWERSKHMVTSFLSLKFMQWLGGPTVSL